MKKILISFVLFASLLVASNYKYEITPTIGGVMPEGNLDLSNQLSYGLRFGININTIFDQIELGFERIDNVDYDNSNANTDINRYFVNVIKSYPLRDNLSLYSLIGVGYESIKNEMFGNNDSGFFNYGLGLKYKVTDNFSLRAEVRHAIKFDHGDSNLFYTVGFVIPFGKKAEPAPIPTPMPIIKKEAPKPMLVVKKVTPAPKPVVIGDDDHDGVNNNEDLCPNTPVGNVVNSDGCVKVIHLHVNFAFNEAHIPSSYMSQIQKVASFMLINDNYAVVLEGNTDSIGSKRYNQKLSILRANAVADVLEKLGVHPKRITKKGFGESNPIATNKTKVGRAQNRRVDAKFMK